MTISQLDDTMRAILGAVKRWYVHQNGSLVTAGSGNAYTLTTGSSHAAFADLPVLVFRADRANTGAATLNVDGLGDIAMTIKGAQALESGNITADQMIAAVPNPDQNRFELTLLGAAISAADLASSTLGFALVNGALQASVAGNVLTIAVKTLAGGDPSASDPVFALFRSSTLTSGAFVVRKIEAALSIDAPDGATLGTTANEAFNLWITLHDDNGTVRLGVSNRKQPTGIAPINEAAKSTTTAISSAADSAATYYTATAITTAAPLQVVGYVEYAAGLATAGTYNIAPTKVHLHSLGSKLPGEVVQRHWKEKTDTTNTSSPHNDFQDITGLSLALDIQSAANQVLVESFLMLGGLGGRYAHAKILRGSTELSVGDAALQRKRVQGGCDVTNENPVHPLPMHALDNPGAAGSTTYKVQWASESNTGQIYLNRSQDDTDDGNHPRAVSTLFATEIAG